MDQCMNCTVRGDIDACMKTPCSQHESWYAQTLKAQQRTWVGLTDEEVVQIRDDMTLDIRSHVDFYRHCEAKLKEKNTIIQTYPEKDKS